MVLKVPQAQIPHLGLRMISRIKISASVPYGQHWTSRAYQAVVLNEHRVEVQVAVGDATAV